MQKLKPVMPSLREKKRYLAYEVLSNSKVDVNSVAKSLWNSALGFVGELGAAKMGLIVLTDNFNSSKQRGIVRVAHNMIDELKASLTLITNIDGRPATVRSITVSGNINKAKAAIN